VADDDQPNSAHHDDPKPVSGMARPTSRWQGNKVGRASIQPNREKEQTPMNKIILIVAIVATAAALVAFQAHAQQQRSFTDHNGRFDGSAVTRGNSTTFTDRNGRFDGTTIRNSNGTTSTYDARGHFVGSSTNTSQPK
jgi:hypothetical protein